MLKNENMCNQQGPLYTILTHTHTDAVSRSEETTKRSKDKTTERPNLKTKKKKISRRMNEKKIFLNIKHGEKSDRNSTEYFCEEKLVCLPLAARHVSL